MRVIGGPRPIAFRRLQERVVDAQRERAPVRRDVVHEQARIVGRERDHRFDLGVLRERLHARRVEGAARRIESERALVQRSQAAFDVGGIAHEERRGIGEHASTFFGFDRQRREHGRGERVAHVLHLRRTAADGAIVEVLRHHQHARSGSLEANHAV